MKKIVLTFGVISGLVASTLMVLTCIAITTGAMGFDNAELIGYSGIVLSFLLVFFGIRTYRENVGQGTITFGRAFKVGILITLINCAFYVVTWEIVYFNYAPDFAVKMAAHVTQEMREEGATDAEIAAKQAQWNQLDKLYKNPILNALVTLIEPLPVGIVMTLISAAILRKRAAPVMHAMA